ncbi:MAG: hypothetical protein JF610_15590 [Acidobacteria bacterium]|nr:hypothetical protein [Acidobacteriota bacterium]
MLALFFITFLPLTASAVTVRDVVELTRAGVGEEVLLALIEVDRSIFPIDAATIKELKSSGVSERVILAMVRSGREVTPVEQPVPAPVEPPEAPQPQVVVIDHHDAPEVREVPVAVPIYIPVATRATHSRTHDGGSNGIPISSERWIAEHMPAQAPAKQAEPVYWGFGGKLRPDAWKPAPDPSDKHKQ